MPTPQAVREQVKRISKTLMGNQCALLSYVVEEHLAGRTLSEKSIGAGLFGYDPKQLRPDTDKGEKEGLSNVRVQMGRLREKLENYYNNADSNDFIHIELPERNYNPVILARFEEINVKDRILLRRANEARELRTAPGFEQGISMLNEILTAHPDHPVILGRLAELHSLRVIHTVAPARPDLEAACSYAERALVKSKKVWEAYAALGAVHACKDWDWKKAESAFDEALDIVGLRLKSLPWYRAFLTSQRRFSELIEELEQVINDLADIGPSLRRNLGIAQMFSGDYDEAIRNLQSAIPHHTAHLYLGMIYEAQGNFEKALEQARLANSRPGSEYLVPGFLVLALAREGRRDEALAEWSALKTASHYVSSFQMAIAHLGLGEIEQALDFLEMSSETREFSAIWLSCWPTVRQLHGHPRFQALLLKMGLPEPC